MRRVRLSFFGEQAWPPACMHAAYAKRTLACRNVQMLGSKTPKHAPTGTDRGRIDVTCVRVFATGEAVRRVTELLAEPWTPFLLRHATPYNAQTARHLPLFPLPLTLRGSGGHGWWSPGGEILGSHDGGSHLEARGCLLVLIRLYVDVCTWALVVRGRTGGNSGGGGGVSVREHAGQTVTRK